jgi:hypothetical protein
MPSTQGLCVGHPNLIADRAGRHQLLGELLRYGDHKHDWRPSLVVSRGGLIEMRLLGPSLECCS